MSEHNKQIFSENKQVFICWLVIMSTAFTIGLYKVSDSGMQWAEDGARYLNNAAMIHDYLLSDQLLHPYEFAKQNYKALPAFSIPYHPPGYALLLAVWFLIFGMSFEIARCFIAFLSGIAGCFFFNILKNQKVPVWHALLGSVLFITSYEIVRWERSTMSEIPALTFMMAGSYFFLRWLSSGKGAFCGTAFFFAMVAFFCRVSSAGLLPAWILYYFAVKGFKGRIPKALISSSVIYIVCGALWVKFVSGFAKHEIRSGLDISGRIQALADFDKLTIWLKALPDMVGPTILACSMAGVFFLTQRKKKDILKFWMLWVLSYYVFNMMVSTHYESRYFIFALPGLFALSIGSLASLNNNSFMKKVFWGVLFVTVFMNTLYLSKIHMGVTGHEEVATVLSRLKQPGNVLVSCWNDADLMFRYRCKKQNMKRQMIRGDRTLAIRISDYAKVPAKEIVKNKEDLVQIIRQGRIRYILTASPFPGENDKYPMEMKLAHEMVSTDKELFILVDQFKILHDFDIRYKADIFLWRFEGALPHGKSELPVIIPTANILIES